MSTDVYFYRLIFLFLTLSMDDRAEVTEGEESRVERSDDRETFQLLETKNDDPNANFVTRGETFNVAITGVPINYFFLNQICTR